MKSKNSRLNTALFILISGFCFAVACQERDEDLIKTRLFRPVLNEQLYSLGNSIIVDMGKLKEAVSYTLEVSRDTFKTTDYVVDVDTNYVVIDETLVGEELLWFTLYQVRVTAHADDPQYDSKLSDLGNVRTQKFPSNQGAPQAYDVTDVRARVFWTTIGAPVTHVKVFSIDDIRLKEPLMTFEVTMDEQNAEEKIISGLEPATRYQIAIYSGDELRGWEVYMTKSLEPAGDNVIDLRGISKTTILADTLPDIAGGSIVLLQNGLTYETGGYEFDKSITIRSGYDFNPDPAMINCGSNFNIAASAVIDSIVFRGVSFSGDYGGNYVFNIDQSGNIGEIKYDGCHLHSLRGVTRIKGGIGTLDKFTIVNSVVDSINGYGVLSVDTEGWTAGDILLKNSTFSKTIYFLVSRTNTGSVTVESCTLSELPEKGRQIFRWRGADGNNNVINGITISNSIFGHGWDPEATGDVSVDGFDGLGSTTFNIVNTYATSDFAIAGGKDAIPGFPNFIYDGKAAQLWRDPYVSLDFSFGDSSFAGKRDAGDPQWREGL